MLDYKAEKPDGAAAKRGCRADYVYREAKRARAALTGAKTQLWPGIDIDIPTAATSSSNLRPEGRTMRCWRLSAGGADGVILSRKWSEMKSGNLKGAGAAIKQVLA